MNHTLPTKKLTRCVLVLAAAVALGADLARAEVTVNTTIPLDGIPVDFPCLGETAVFAGPLHVLLTFTIDANGGVHGKFHFQPQGLVAIGEITGDTYRATGETQGNFNTTAAEVTTFVNNFKIIGPGTDNNFLAHDTINFVINANGEVTATVVNSTVDCK